MLDTDQNQDQDALAGGLADILIAGGKLATSDLERAQRLQRETRERLDVILTRLGLVSERDMAEALSAHLDLPVVEAADYPVHPVLEDRISPKFLKEHRVLPLADTAEGLVLVMADPLDAYAIQGARLVAEKPVLPRVGVPADIEAAIERLYGGDGASIEQISEGAVDDSDDTTADDIGRLQDLASEAPVIRLVNLLISRAVEMRASDIHIEPFERKLRVRYRIDGVLRDVEAPPNRLRAAIASRVKIMAKLNIAERRLPQDGRIRLAVRGQQIDLRVSTVPTMHGESVVMRVLDQGAVALDFAALGLADETLARFLEVLEQPTGILLVTGPTGSGKTTTLYTSLTRLDTGDNKILTVEDPIEYELEGINQVAVKPQIGLDFANTLRHFLRQDPDIIMVGEIRDLETVEIAVQAALTGHKVLSTLHTNDAAGTITRLLDMGVKDYLVTSTLNGVVAQRLVRTLCPDCRVKRPALPEIVERLELDRASGGDKELSLYEPAGCERCDGAGYLGRTAIHEVLVMSDALRRLVLQHGEAHRIQEAAVADGMRTMYGDGVAKVLAGITTLDEVLRVTRED